MSVPLLQTPPGSTVKIDGREYLYFVGTGYLGLQNHPEVIRAARETVEQFGIGSANSRTAFGTTEPVLNVERAAARLFGVDDAFYYASGWMGANILIPSLGLNDGLVFVDECSHYSLFEAARASGFSCETFVHRDADSLREKLEKHLKPGYRPLVLSDGVFAATGKIAPVEDFLSVLEAYPGSMLFLDDAHGLAVLGQHGRGTFEHAGMWGRGVNSIDVADRPHPNPLPKGEGTTASVFPKSEETGAFASPKREGAVALPCPALLMAGTLSKAVGGYGGIIPGSREFIDRLKWSSPYFGGASPPPTPIAAATARAMELIMADPSLRTGLWANVRRLKDGLRQLGLEVDDTPAPIVCLEIGTAENMRRIQTELMALGIVIAYMATYSGLGPEGGLRLAVFATHTKEMIERLVDALRAVV
jgi:7-keto-8-aminopelargonate synthetase-like enzyme